MRLGKENERVFIRINKKGWADLTNEITSISFQGDSYYVRFRMGKAYHFATHCVVTLSDCVPLSFDPSAFSSFFQQEVSGVYESCGRILSFDHRHGLRKMSPERWNQFQNFQNFIKKSFGYYRDLASIYDREGDSDFLAAQYDKIQKDWQGHVLKDVLYRTERTFQNPDLIFPFPHNFNQMKAIKMGMSSNVSVIQGPPGTGKTQTILNLIANILVQGKTVAIISNNNAAVRNVYDKMEEAGYGFLCANLGNLANRELFFSQEHERKRLPQGERDPRLLDLIKEEQFYFANDIKKGELMEERSKLRMQYVRSGAQKDASLKIKVSVPSNKIIRFAATLEKRGKERLGLFVRLKLRCRYGVSSKPYKKNASFLSEQLKFAYVERRLEELDKEIRDIEDEMKRYEATGSQQKILESSRYIWNRALSKRLDSLKEVAYDASSFKLKFSSFIQRYPVILSSTYSLPSTVPSSFCFDYLIIDEASQSTITTVLPSLTKGNNLIVIGDDKQLPPVIPEQVISQEKQLAHRYGIESLYRDDGKSFLTFIQNQMPKTMPATLLREHYRCSPEIIGFSNERIYGNELVLERANDGGTHLKLIQTVPGNHARRNDTGGPGLYNQREIDEIARALENMPQKKGVGVITPYRRQAELLRNVLPEDVEVGTIHTFQGQEYQTIFLSCVANDADDYRKDDEIRRAFVNDERMINVAVTRAKDEFILVVSDKIAHSQKGILADLVKYITYQTGSVVEEGHIRSIFDLLYEDYAETRKELFSGKNVASEELMSKVLDSILSQEEFSSFQYSMHVTLKSVVKIDSKKYSVDEYKYLSHPWTHLDFVIFNRFDKIPVLAIEVDGIAYHEQCSKQLNRDALKDRCLSDCHLPILRVKTNQANVKTSVVKALRSSWNNQ